MKYFFNNLLKRNNNHAENNQDRNAAMYRYVQLDRKSANDEQRTIEASLSSEHPVRRWFGNEILVHADGAVALDRAAGGLPLLFNHDSGVPIGKVEDVRLVDGKLRGTLRFSKNPKATEVWQDVRDGFLSHLSVGYRALKWEETDGSDDVRVTSWEVFEASIVPVPADHTVGIGRSNSQEENEMRFHDKRILATPAEQPGSGGSGETGTVTNLDSVRRQAIGQGEQQGVEKERKRVADIRSRLQPYVGRADIRALIDDAIVEGWSPDDATTRALELIGGNAQPVSSDHAQTQTRASRPTGSYVVAGDTHLEKQIRGIELALNVRAKNEKDEKLILEANSGEFRAMSMTEMARAFLIACGVNVRGLDRDAIVGKAFLMRGVIAHGTADFANILENVANKSVLRGFQSAEEVWDRFVRKVPTNDFKPMSLVGKTGFSDLLPLTENGEFKEGTITDLKELLQAFTFGRKFNITRAAIINDDIGALSDIPAVIGRAGTRLVGDKVFTLLINGHSLAMNEDGVAVFHSSHNNLVASSGGPPSVATLDVAKVAMAKQKDPNTQKALNIRLKHVIVPVALETATLTLKAAQYDPAGTTASKSTRDAPNPFQGKFEVTADARLDADSATEWYSLADQNEQDTIAVSFLNGKEVPTVETMSVWDALGVSMRVYLDVGAAWIGWRGAHKNVGA